MLRGNCITVLVLGALAWGQNPAQPGMGPGGNGSPGGNPSGAGSNSGTSNSGTASGANSLRRLRNPSSDLPRGEGSGEPISGRVVLSDGAEPSAAIAVQRVCGSAVTGETHPDSTGRFTVPRAAGNAYAADISRTNTGDAGSCELRASLGGYRTGTWALGNGRSTSSGGDVVLVLHRVGAAPGMTVSATSLLAPKGARRAYGKGLDAVRRHDPDAAQKEFSEAVRIYPRYAAAWLELGKVYEQRNHRSQARGAYARAIAADGGFLFPYDRLYRMDVKESRWKEAADASSQVLRLNPYDFPEAFYFNAVSNLELNQLDAAERSAREAAKLEGVQAEPRSNYVLGVILWRKGDLEGAQEKFQDFLAAASAEGFSAGLEQASARKMLAEIERQKIPGEAAK